MKKDSRYAHPLPKAESHRALTLEEGHPDVGDHLIAAAKTVFNAPDFRKSQAGIEFYRRLVVGEDAQGYPRSPGLITGKDDHLFHELTAKALSPVAPFDRYTEQTTVQAEFE